VAIATNYFIPGFSLALGFLLGGIVSPPDAVSTGAIMKFVKIPKAMATLLEGESLLNDASSLIIFRFALAAVATGQFLFSDAITSFSWMIAGGIGSGLLFGWLFVQAHKYLPTDAPSDIIFTLIEPYFLYWIAEKLQSSGVLAVVCGGLFMANRQFSFLTSASRVKGYSFWEAFIFVLNGIVFLLIGLELPEIMAGLRADGIPVGTAIFYGVIVTVILILTRMISSYVALITTLIFRPSVAPNRGNTRRMWKMPLLLGWTGMRGVVSLAAALAIPTTLSSGIPFPHRSLILFITFTVILLSLLVQGLTLPVIIRRSSLFDFTLGANEDEVRLKMKTMLVTETVRILKEKNGEREGGNWYLQHLITQWEHKISQPEHLKMNDETKTAYLELLEKQRQFLSQLNKEPDMDDEIIFDQIYQIDLEEERVKLL
jgi:CPA1 family monovalent cation:H+ antiporter